MIPIQDILKRKQHTLSQKKETIDAQVSLFFERMHIPRATFFFQGTTLFVTVPKDLDRTHLHFAGEDILTRLHLFLEEQGVSRKVTRIRFLAPKNHIVT